MLREFEWTQRCMKMGDVVQMRGQRPSGGFHSETGTRWTQTTDTTGGGEIVIKIVITGMDTGEEVHEEPETRYHVSAGKAAGFWVGAIIALALLL